MSDETPNIAKWQTWRRVRSGVLVRITRIDHQFISGVRAEPWQSWDICWETIDTHPRSRRRRGASYAESWLKHYEFVSEGS